MLPDRWSQGEACSKGRSNLIDPNQDVICFLIGQT